VKLTYLRSQLGSQAAIVQDEIDPAFVNDQYWLLFPLHVAWDGSANVEDTGMHKLPLGKGSAERVLVKFCTKRPRGSRLERPRQPSITIAGQVPTADAR
jgi:hypothetical protein